MNIVKSALNVAGIKVPIKRRIWNWLRDHPSKTAREIATALNEKTNHVQSELRDMTLRKMVKATPMLHRPYRGAGRKTLFEYAVTESEYELLPYSQFNSPSNKLLVPSGKLNDVVKYGTASAAKPETVQPLANAKLDVQALPLAEARRIYEELKEIFG